MPDNQPSYRTFSGSILSVFTLILVLFYAGWKLVTMFSQEDYKVQVNEQTNFYDYKQTFGIEDGFNFAAALTAYDGSSEDITDLSVGRMKFVTKNWDSEDPKMETFADLESEPCDQEKLLNGGTNGSEYFKLDESTANDSRVYAPKMLCPVNLQKDKLQGNYNTQKAKNIMIVFEKCDSSWKDVTCKSEEDMKKWMTGKYFVVLSNQKKFIPYKFGDERMEI